MTKPELIGKNSFPQHPLMLIENRNVVTKSVEAGVGVGRYHALLHFAKKAFLFEPNLPTLRIPEAATRPGESNT